MRKEDKSLFGRNTMVPIRDGRLSIKIRLKKLQLKESTKILDSMSIDHSILSQKCKCTELLKQLEQTMFKSRDMSREELHNNSTLIQNLSKSSLNTGRTTAWKSKVMVLTRTSE